MDNATQDSSRFNTDMTKGRPAKLLFFFSLPLLAGNVLQQLYTFMDGVVVGKFVSNEALAGVTTTAPIVLLLTSLFVGVGLGAMTLLSQYYGAGDIESVRRMMQTVYSLMVLLVVPLTVLGILFAEPMLRLINVPEEAFDQSQRYMIIILLGLLPSFGFNINMGILQGLGNSMAPFIMLAVSSIGNIALDFVFVPGFGWGVDGAAISTIMAEAACWLWSIFYIKKRCPFLQFRALSFGIDRQLLKQAVRISLPSGINQVLFAGGALTMQSLVNSFGSVFLAGYSGAYRFESFSFLPITSISTAITTFVAQNWGAGNQQRMRQGIRTGLWMSVVLGVALPVLILPFTGDLMSIFINSEDALNATVIINTGSAYLWRVMPFYVILTVMYALNAALRGVGQMMLPMLSTLISMIVVRVPVAYLFADKFGPDNLYFSYAIGWAVGLAITGIYYGKGKWKTRPFTVEQPKELYS